MRFELSVRGLAVLVVGSLVPPLSPVQAQPYPLDAAEFQVNTYTGGNQSGGGVARLQGGGFVVVWTSDGSPESDTSGYSVQARRFAASGEPAGDQFQVNAYTTGNQSLPRVAAGADGGFLVVWASLGSFGNDDQGYSVQARRFDRAGVALDPVEFQVNSYTSGNLYEQPDQIAAEVAPGSTGNFIVTWQSGGSQGSDQGGFSIQARRLRPDGTFLDAQEFQVNTYTSGQQTRARVAAGPSGDFVITWTSSGSFGDDDWEDSIQARRFSADGAPLDAQEFQVNTLTAYDQFASAIAADARGAFVVVWASDITTMGDIFGVQARRFDESGIPLDPVELQVNEYTTAGQGMPVVGMNGAGDFVVVWYSVGSFGTDLDASIQARRFRSDGLPVEDQEIQLNSFTTSPQYVPRLAIGPDGDLVAVWTSAGSFGTDQDLLSVQARRFGRPTIEVNSTSGGTGGPGCTLRDALTAASSGVPVGECPAGNEGANVELPAGVAIRLGAVDNGLNGLPLVERPVTVRGAGSRIERDPGLACPAGPQFRLFEVVSTGVLELEDVVLANGCAPGGPGGAVLVEGGTLLLREATIEGSEAGAEGGGVAVLDGSLTAVDSTVRGNLAGGAGGGLFVGGDPGWLRLESVTVSENIAASGGGLSFSSVVPALVRNATFSGNAATAGGGGMELAGAAPTLALDFATVAANAAPAGAGVLASSGVLFLHGSLVGESASGEDCAAGAGTVVASGANLDTDGSCAALAGGNVATVGSLGLGPLADNGGWARSHLPLAGSPALDAAPACATASGAPLLLDGRGYPRPTDDDGDAQPECELGAVERGPLFLDGWESADTRRWTFAAR